ncbi:hypothetical protein HDU81_008058 [Chytriomyces hyalinus]|nr:hypothetical protein HDU81_008058 [Chytriomyces hyalinus]
MPCKYDIKEPSHTSHFLHQKQSKAFNHPQKPLHNNNTHTHPLNRPSIQSTSTMSAKQLVETAIASNKVVVFSKSYCPYCRKAKALLDSLGAQYEAVELDQREDGSDIQAYLADKTGQRTVPNVFIGGKQIGGCDDVHALHAKGGLKPLL